MISCKFSVKHTLVFSIFFVSSLTLSSHSDFVKARAQISRRDVDLAVPFELRSIVFVLVAIFCVIRFITNKNFSSFNELINKLFTISKVGYADKKLQVISINCQALNS